MKEWKPKPIKGLKVEYNGTIYDKITNISCDNESMYFTHMPNESTSINVNCKPSEAKVIMGGDK